MAKPKLGTGGRFKALVKKVESEGKSAKSAKAIAAAAGIKRYGKTRMENMAKAGRMKKIKY